MRVTKRCLAEDLGAPPDADFELLVERFEIVKALRRERADTAEGSSTVGAAAGAKTLYTLRHGDDHRGATWHDAEHEVLWLCAYGLHRSGEPADAFQHFERLLNEHRIYPSVEDYRSLFMERDERFVEMLQEDAARLLDEARKSPESEVTAVLAGAIESSAVVVVVETLSETYVAFQVPDAGERVILILTAFVPTSRMSDWELVDRLPTREVRTDDDEIAFRYFHG